MTKTIYLFSISSHPDTISVSSLDINFFQPFIDFSNYDYLIITSKQVSQALLGYKREEFVQKKALCISKESAKSFEEIGGSILEIGKGYGDTLFDTIKQYPKSTKWLYLRAKVVASHFVEESQKEGYSIDEMVVYESQCSQEIQNIVTKKRSVLIFTSPSSLKCFLKNHTIEKDQKVVVIGKTTAKIVPKGVDYTLAPQKTIESCVNIASSL